MRKEMTRRDMALEMIRAKRSVPVVYTRTGDIYASMQEAADELGICRQIVSREVAKARRGKNAMFKVAEDWEPYAELKGCESVDEYVLHYLRVYYPELYDDSVHVVDRAAVEQRMNYHDVNGTMPHISITDSGEYYDEWTGEVIE